MVSKEVLRHLVIQQKALIEKPGDFVERTIFSQVLDAMNDNRVLNFADPPAKTCPDRHGRDPAFPTRV